MRSVSITPAFCQSKSEYHSDQNDIQACHYLQRMGSDNLDSRELAHCTHFSKEAKVPKMASKGDGTLLSKLYDLELEKSLMVNNLNFMLKLLSLRTLRFLSRILQFTAWSV